MTNPLSLQNKRIMVTGASSGIGSACAILAANLGASVVLVARDKTRLESIREQMNSDVEHKVIQYDLTDFDHYTDFFKVCTEEKKLDGLVHAAGICPALPIQSLSLAVMREVLNINYLSFMELVKLFSKRRYSEGGSVVAISSVSSQAGWAGGSAYCGSKGALEASVRALAIELSQKNIRVNSVVPSNIQTPMLDQLLSVGGEESAKMIESKQPLGFGSPNDVANAVVFLLSEASRFITGTNLVIDGGYLAQ